MISGRYEHRRKLATDTHAAELTMCMNSFEAKAKAQGQRQCNGAADALWLVW